MRRNTFKLKTMKTIFKNKKSKSDSRDIKLGAVQLPVDYPEEYETNISDVEALWQNGYPMCGSHAGSHAKTVLDKFDTGVTERLSPVYLWKKIKLIDGYMPEDGTDMRSIFKALQNNGVCSYYKLPTDYTKSLQELTEDDTTKEQNEDAQVRIIKAYGFTGTDLESIKRAIYQNKIVVILLTIGDSWKAMRIFPFKTLWGGHFVIANGYNTTGIKILDSADKDTPRKILDNSYKKYIREVGTMLDLPNDVVKNLTKKISLIQQIIELMKKVALLKK